MAEVVVGEDSVFGNETGDTKPSVDGLIMRLQGATGTDYDIDASIAALCHPTDDPRLAAFENGRDYPDRYTSCIDAALTLVPEGWSWHVGVYERDHLDKPLICAEVANDRDGIQSAKKGVCRVEGAAATPALALCLAALSARKTVPQTVAGTDATTSNTESSPHT